MTDDWIRPEPPFAGRVGALTTTRAGGVSHGVYDSLNLAGHVGDDPDSVAENRRLLRTAVGLEAIQWLDQVHGTRVIKADATTHAQTPEADALWTDEPGIGLGILTADCLPVVIAAADASAVGVAHAGWRGLLAGVLEALLAELPGPTSGYQAWIGPAISQPSYEVGEDVAEQVQLQAGERFLEAGRSEGKYQLDLPGLAVDKLKRAGLSRVAVSNICSLLDRRCYSYRRDGQTGRMATLAWLI